MRHQVEVGLLEFDEGGNTIWVHSPRGGTVLRVQCTGKIKVDEACTNTVAHADVQVIGDITVCVPEEDA